MEEKIKLQELIDITTKYINGTISQEEFADFGNQMMIRNYIPIQEKIGIIMGIMVTYKFSDVSVQEIKVGELYRALFFHVLLSTYAFIDCSDTDLISYENYDLLYPIFSPFLLAYCKDDYELFRQMLEDSINMYAITDMINFFNGIDEESLKNSSEENKRIMQEFEENKDTVKDLKDIMEMNNPAVAKIVEELQKTARENVMNNLE